MLSIFLKSKECEGGSSYIQINATREMSYGHNKVFSAVSVFHIFNEI